MSTPQQKAITKALAAGLHRRVVRIKRGTYLVPSTTREVVHCVGHNPDEPHLAEHLTCSCEARYHPACTHRAAVWLAKMEAAGLRVKPSTATVRTERKAA